jgi:hypothetical protein
MLVGAKGIQDDMVLWKRGGIVRCCLAEQTTWHVNATIGGGVAAKAWWTTPATELEQNNWAGQCNEGGSNNCCWAAFIGT